MAEPRSKSPNPKGSLIDFESSKIRKAVQSTTVAELYAFMKCYGTCQYLRGLWMDMTGEVADIHMRTDANNLVTTASTTHLPEQKETIHMINMLRHESCSGAIADLAHVTTTEQLADVFTKEKGIDQNLKDAVRTGILQHCDKNIPFREMMRTKHKAFFTNWLCRHLKYDKLHTAVSFLGYHIQREIHMCLAGWPEFCVT